MGRCCIAAARSNSWRQIVHEVAYLLINGD
jgi:hypothetical protein